MRTTQEAPGRALGRASGSPAAAAAPHAFVLGDVDLVYALGHAGIRSVVVTPPADPARHSRHVVGRVPWVDHWKNPEELVRRLVDAAHEWPRPPVLCYQSDGDLLVVSRYRAELAGTFRFVVAPSALVEDLVDKGRFARLAETRRLPVPATVALDPESTVRQRLDGLRLPVVVKPWTREGLVQLGEAAKAVRVETHDHLRAVTSRGLQRGVGLVVQELVEGPESAIESYHAYVDLHGTVVASFTGAKVRTHPRELGHSTVLVTTEAHDVRAAGERVVAELELTGLVKADFKRDRAGRLWLLEVNPRYTLWHHLGAVAGTNLPALVHADLAGLPRPAVAPVPAGMTWCDPVRDLRAVAAGEVTPRAWVRAVWSCSAHSGAAWADLGPLVRGQLRKALRHVPHCSHGAAAA